MTARTLPVEGIGTFGFPPVGGVITVQGPFPNGDLGVQISGGGPVDVSGDTVQDSPDNILIPVGIGGRASAAVPGAMSADGDRVATWHSRYGALVSAGGVLVAGADGRLNTREFNFLGAENTAGTAGPAGVFPYVYNPTAGTWDRLRGGASKGQRVTLSETFPHVFVAGGANAIATMTLPAPGAGLFQWITYLRIARVATAALAGAAILAVTSTNLLGGPQWRTGNAMVAGGTTDLINMAFASPWRANAANVAVTFVGPAAGVAVSWDMECGYFVGPAE